MGLTVFEMGDVVYYPYPMKKSERTMTVLDRNIIRYNQTGKMFIQYLYDGLLEHIVEDMHANVDNDLDNLVVISGREGSGKSNLAYHLCKLFQPDFNLEAGYIYEFNSFIKKLHDEPGGDRGRVFWMDEATNIASNRDWMRTDNKAFIQMLEMMRSRGWTLVMCIPSVDRLDVYIREYRLRYLLIARETGWENHSTRSRGYVEVKFPRGGGRWSTIGFAKFPKMPPDVKEEYESVKMGHQKEKITELKEKADSEKRSKEGMRADKRRIRSLMLYLHENVGLTYPEIASISGYAKDSVKEIVTQARLDRDQGVSP